VPDKKPSQDAIEYPYIHPQGTIRYVDADNPYMQEAKQFAANHSLDQAMPTGSVIVRDGQVLGHGANGSDYHKQNECERVKQGTPTGQGYELCEGCHPKNHSEPKAVADALSRAESLADAALYLWGHWWCCKPCWRSMASSGIRTVFLQKNSEVLFNKAAPGNIVGKQLIA
jgi:deoxycytidylate deaminase